MRHTWAIVLAALAFSGCAKVASGERRPNVLLISIDTLRADHLGCYGYERETSPRIDAFARSATRFEQAFAPSPWTFTSHVEMLTGRNPYQLGATTKESPVPEHVPVLTESLGQAGYQSAAFVDSTPRGYLGGERGFARGFDSYNHAPHREGLDFAYDMQVTLEVGLDWLRRARDPARPFFLFLHTKSVHTVKGGTPRADHRVPPYDVPTAPRFRFLTDEQAALPWSSPEFGEGGSYLTQLNGLLRKGRLDREAFPRVQLEALVAQYDGCIRYVDERLGELFDTMRAEGLYDETLIILTADHGEEFLDHGQFKHVQVYHELLHVPLIVKFPGQSEGHVVQTDAKLADIVPTILDQAGLAGPDALEGRPLLSTGLDALPPRTIFGTHRKPQAREPKQELFSLRRDGWTLVYTADLERDTTDVALYHSARDPEQARRVSDQRRIKEMLDVLERWRRNAAVQGEAEIEIDEATEKHLRALGYTR